MKAKMPAKGSAAEYAYLNGIASLKGLPLIEGTKTVYISSRDIDRLIADDALNKPDAELFLVWKQRVSAGVSPNSQDLHSIDLNAVLVCKAGPQAHVDQFRDLLTQYLNDPRNSSEAEQLGPMQKLVRHRLEDGVWHVKCDFPGADGLTEHRVDSEDLFGWMWQQMKFCMKA